MSSPFALATSSLLVGSLALTCGLFVAVSTIQQTPYMDEIFHVPQAQRYCARNFTYWDPKLTTLPGLYVASIVVLEPVAAMLGTTPTPLCTTLSLRLHSLLFWIATLYLLYKIHSYLYGNDRVAVILLGFFPLFYFYAFLYYTDVASTFFVLLTYLLALKGRNWSSAFVGALAVTCRQTNIIWVGFSLAVAVLRDAEVVAEKKQKDDKKSDFDFLIAMATATITGLRRVFWFALPYGIVVYLFAIFLYWNGGIVVGDRTSHVASFHLMQMLYFYVFVLAMGLPHFVNPSNLRTSIGRILRLGIQLILLIPLIVSVLFLIIKNYTIIHPYLRDDNRHFTFYIWRKFFAQNRLMKYAWIPVYPIAALLLHVRANEEQVGAKSRVGALLWQLGFLLCTALCIVPQRLVEFRYFVVPYMLLRLHLGRSSFGAILWVEFLLYVVVNAIVFSLFLFRPFVWAHEPEQLQRFMW